MRISDWSSDVCSSDLRQDPEVRYPRPDRGRAADAGARGRRHAAIRGGMSMRAIVVDEFGPIGNARPGEAPAPVPGPGDVLVEVRATRSEEHPSALQSLMRTSSAVFCLKKKKKQKIRI